MSANAWPVGNDFQLPPSHIELQTSHFTSDFTRQTSDFPPMGYDATCTLTFDGKTTRGTALLEHKDLVFRGPVRLAIPLATITEATAREGTLHLRFGGKSSRARNRIRSREVGQSHHQPAVEAGQAGGEGRYDGRADRRPR